MIPDVELLVAQRPVFDARLQIGAVTNSITVNETSPLIETSSSDVGRVVNTVTSRTLTRFRSSTCRALVCRRNTGAQQIS